MTESEFAELEKGTIIVVQTPLFVGTQIVVPEKTVATVAAIASNAVIVEWGESERGAIPHRFAAHFEKIDPPLGGFLLKSYSLSYQGGAQQLSTVL